jgi:hypothetical protein
MMRTLNPDKSVLYAFDEYMAVSFERLPTSINFSRRNRDG